MDGSTGFSRNWTDYKYGFGNMERDFWLGLEPIHILTNLEPQELRLDIEYFNNSKKSYLYKNFTIDGEGNNYYYSGYSAKIDNSDYLFESRLQYFSTFDRDNDREANKNYAKILNNGWWHWRGTNVWYV
mgnify:CR=1 FL=1